MMNKIFSFVFIFIVFVFSIGSVSAKCWSYDDNEDGIIDYKWYSIDPTFIIGSPKIVFDPDYVNDTLINRGFAPSAPFSVLDTIMIEYETKEVYLPDCYGGEYESTDEQGNPITAYDPFRYFGGFSFVPWEITLEDSSGNVFGTWYYNVGDDALTDGGGNQYKRVKYQGRIPIKLDSLDRHCPNGNDCPWPSNDYDLNIIENETAFNDFVKAIDEGKNIKFKISSTYTGYDEYGAPYRSEADLIKEVPIKVSNCVRDSGNGPIKVVTGYKQFIADDIEIAGINPWSFSSTVNEKYLSSVDPYLKYGNLFSYYSYLGDYSKMKEGKCGGAKYVVFQNDIIETKEEAKGNTAFVPLFGLGLSDPYLSQKYVHGFSHIFAKLRDENVVGNVAVGQKGINCISSNEVKSWEVWSNRVWGCGGKKDLLRSSQTSLMFLNLLNYTGLGNEISTYVPSNSLFNIVSCAYITSYLGRNNNYLNNVKECYNGHYIIKPSFPGIRVRFPDGTVAEDYQ